MSHHHNRPAIVVDNGTGYTKLGFASNTAPSFVVPTCVSVSGGGVSSSSSSVLTQSKKEEKDESNFPGNGNSKKKKKKKAYEYYSHHNHASKSLQDLNYSIGEDALAQINSKTIKWPISNGIVNDWTSMEKFWQKTLLNVLRVEPEEHFFLLTEPPLNPAENRERIGEIMFETFNVPGVHIGVQAVLALNASVALNASAAAASSKKNRNGDEENSGNDTSKKDRNDGLTGTVIDIGDGVTHVIPVCDGYVVSSAIKSVPLAGRDLTRCLKIQV